MTLTGPLSGELTPTTNEPTPGHFMVTTVDTANVKVGTVEALGERGIISGLL